MILSKNVLIVLLLLLNVGLTTVLIINKYEKKDKKTFWDKDAWKQRWERVGFTGEQKVHADSLKKDYWDKAKLDFKELGKLRNEMFDKLDGTAEGRAKAFEIADSLGTVHSEMNHRLIEHFLELSEGATPQQVDSLRNYFTVFGPSKKDKKDDKEKENNQSK
jgi:hypothetical protein